MTTTIELVAFWIALAIAIACQFIKGRRGTLASNIAVLIVVILLVRIEVRREVKQLMRMQNFERHP